MSRQLWKLLGLKEEKMQTFYHILREIQWSAKLQAKNSIPRVVKTKAIISLH